MMALNNSSKNGQKNPALITQVIPILAVRLPKELPDYIELKNLVKGLMYQLCTSRTKERSEF